MPPVASRLLSRDEAARRLRISPKAVPGLIASGELRTVRAVGLSRSIFESSVEALRRRMNQGRPGAK
jgi:hypothetical protein